MKPIRTIASHWAEFEQGVITADTSQEERGLARASFYAGQDRMFCEMTELLGNAADWPTMERRLKAVQEELRLFAEGIALLASEPPPEALDRLCQAVLLLHRGGPWTADDRRLWREYTGREEATPRTLCDFVREIMGAKPVTVLP